MTVQIAVKDLTLEQLADKIKPIFEQMDANTEKADLANLLPAKKAGRWLKLAKQKIKGMPGYTWQGWVQSNFKKTKQTADNYIRIHDNWPKIEAKIAKDGPMSQRAAIAFLGPDPDEQKKGKEPAQPKPIELDHEQRQNLKNFLEAHGVQIEPDEFAKMLQEVGVNYKRVCTQLEGIAQQIKHDADVQWLESLPGVPGWEDVKDFWGVADLGFTLAQAALEAGLGVNDYAVGENRPGPHWDTLLEGESNRVYLVHGATFNVEEAGRKAVEHILRQPEESLDEGVADQLRARLESLPRTEPPLEQVLPVEEPPTPRKKSRRSEQ